MNLNLVANVLAELNPHGGANPHGNCTSCAVDAGDVLTGGAPKGCASKRGATLIGNACPSNSDNPVKTFELGQFGGNDVWNWLDQEAGVGVYVFETDDHAYNIVKFNGLYVVDANSHNYQQIRQANDAQIWIEADKIMYDYLDPEPDEDNDEILVWFWGGLHINWQRR